LTGRARAVITKCNYRCVGAAEQAGVNTGKLLIDDAHKLLVARRLGAVRRRRCDASADIVSVARVLAVCDCCGDEIGLVCHSGGVGKVDHVVGVVLLIAGATRGKEGVDAGNAGELHAWLVREDVTTTGEAEILPILRDRREVSLRGAPVVGTTAETRNPRGQPRCEEGSLPPFCVRCVSCELA